MKTKKDNSYLIILFACLASITAIACGSIYLKGQKDADEEPITVTTENKMLKNDYDHFLDEEETTTAYQTVMQERPDTIDNSDIENETEEDWNSKAMDNDEATDSSIEVQPVAASTSLPFSQDKTLFWPVDGNIVLEYNMDSTIYFPTLDVYKCNPALVIQSEENTPVKSCNQSLVEEIGYEEEIGNYVTVSLGDGYQLTYGQLENVNVSQGQEVACGDIIGYVAAPTKYYSKEGCNLYLKLTKDDTAIDPLDYLCYE